mmetsp:Transcript_23631/g.57945  ORF Transcript_23631/g.57945 Transcript_23631/m.57945 type:complete len:635 (+) Transcript_23631:103-2007(+)|eukprot:CAMPEP_0113606208 /NCGR_PEP_ID=MMETSP0017_2-20120614/2733_1 /TAXON_ID=2856 /ORGANISM="Cylindrotheca closterium" /LENGTH=634 /DNA_ID=CAMNT_0000514739 /DNA_START=86 /DNA_END=1990 /DNA_ORIENTATION=+ /assembly_acc=CAM_ASM_000147
MGSIASKVYFGCEVTKNIGAYMIYGWSKDAYHGDVKTIADCVADDGEKKEGPTFLADEALVKALSSKAFEQSKLDLLSDDALAKIGRQLEYFHDKEKASEAEMVELAKKLIDQSIWYLPLVSEKIGTDKDREALQKSKCPKVRFGKTELQMPLITCGGMRLQNTWVPDNVPLLSPSRNFVLKSPPQQNIKKCMKHCLSLGINHFETARLYGTSEYQMTEALHELMQEGFCKREDFIFQTKLVSAPTKDFKKSWDATWGNVGEKMGFIDLLGVHAVADNDEKLKDTMAFLQERKKEGKIKHIGFSTHGTSEMIMELINTKQFDYINIHEHFFGSYHGSGTSNTLGGEGNLACVKRALELDMGLFLISPVDKGGKLYRPSQDMVKLCGRELTPIAFGLLYCWKTNGFHTASVGVARPTDLDEVVEAARMMALGTADKHLEAATKRLNDRAVEKLGAEWVVKGLLNLPSMMEESTDGIAVGHILWLYNLLISYGMYEFCYERYQSLVTVSWDKKKSFKEKAAAMSRGNLGRAYDPEVDLTKALEKHYNPELALERIKQVHEWLKDEARKSDEELAELGWHKGYNLTVWEEMAGELDSRAVSRVMLQVTTGGRMGIVKTGPGQSIKQQATQIRNALSA